MVPPPALRRRRPGTRGRGRSRPPRGRRRRCRPRPATSSGRRHRRSGRGSPWRRDRGRLPRARSTSPRPCPCPRHRCPRSPPPREPRPRAEARCEARPGRPRSRQYTCVMSDELICVRLGQVPYEEARGLQERVEAARQAGEIDDVLLLLEHPPVYTRGRRSEAAELPMGEDWYAMQGIEVRDTDRGGQVTYHGPGQLVGYPIVHLGAYGNDVHEYVRRLEQVMIDSLATWGIESEVIEGLTGVWVGGRPPEGRKIGSIGVHVSRGVTTHG